MAATDATQGAAAGTTEAEWLLASPASEAAAPAAQEEAPAAAAEAPTTVESIDEAEKPRLRVEVAMERDAVKLGSKEVQAVLSVVAPPAGDARAPLRLVAVLDKSGSMRGEKLRLVKQTMLLMLRHLSDRDSLGIVEYDTHVRVTAPLTYCTQEGRASLEAALGALHAGSNTNLSGGLLKGIELHAAGQAPQRAVPMLAADFGNCYRCLEEEPEANFGTGSAPEGAKRVHEWTMELRFKDPAAAASVEKVVYTLHETFRERVVEVREAPFRLMRHGWGTFRIFAAVHLRDGSVHQLRHDLAFGEPESFRLVYLPAAGEVPTEAAAAAASSRSWNPFGGWLLGRRPTKQEEASTAAGSAEAAAAPGGLQALSPQEAEGMVCSTFLFTDGLANEGITGSTQICAAAGDALDKLKGRRCSISAFGFGKDHDANLLQTLAERGSGIYSYVEGADQIGSAFGEALGGLLSTTHQNVRLCLDLCPGVSLAKAHTQYNVDAAAAEAGARQTVSIDIDDLFAEERRDILVTLALPDGAEAAGSRPIGCLRARGFAVSACRTEETAPQDLCLAWLSEGSAEAAPHPHVLRHRNRHLVTEALESARTAANSGSLATARQIITAAIDSLQASPLLRQGDETTSNLLVDLQTCLNDLEDRRRYEAYGSKKMACMKGAHGTQRACYGQDFSESYANATMKTMKANFKASVQ